MGSSDALSTLEELLALRAAACDWRLSRGDVGVFAALLMHTGRGFESFPGPTRIASIARLAKSNVKISLEKLKHLRYIEIVRSGTRKKNRYRILDSPTIPDQRIVQKIAKARSQLGLPARPVFPARQISTGPVGRSPAGPVGRSQLGLPTGHELSFNSPKELSCASRLSDDQEDQEQDEAA